jgi:hypothetical protein
VVAARTHIGENVGTTPTHVLIIAAKPTPAPPACCGP